MEQVPEHNSPAKSGAEVVSPRARGRFDGFRIRLLLVGLCLLRICNQFYSS